MEIEPLFPASMADSLRSAINDARRVAIICHISPDGDALGSSLGMACLMNRLGKTVHVVTPDTPPQSLAFLPGFGDIVSATVSTERAHGLVANCDLLFCLDFNSLKRIDKMGPRVESSNAFKVVIDHHENPELFADLMFSYPGSSSTCLLLYRLVAQIGASDLVDRVMAECLMTGILTDTGGLAYNSLDPVLYLVVAELVARGVDKDDLYRKLFRTSSLDRLRLNSFALLEKMTVYPEHRSAVIALSAEELKRFGYVKGMTEGLVNIPLEIPEVIYSIFLREDREQSFVKVSMRSKGDFPVDRFCSECFGGGGHVNAAGGDINGPLSLAISRVVESMSSYDQYLPSE